jgi:hypothetical protein
MPLNGALSIKNLILNNFRPPSTNVSNVALVNIEKMFQSHSMSNNLTSDVYSQFVFNNEYMW